ncbi:hypothetical protein G6F56_011208 [Rhizopus delemar]|nr:hypothetical protein G6F56_011208 [Rhizopus delemar]
MEPRNDFVVIQLAAPGYISAIVMDTSGFEGNTPHSFVVDGCHSQEVDPYVDVNTEWVTLVEKTPCVLNNKAIHFVTYGPPVSHIRLTIYPDGGIQQILALGAPYLPEIQNISNENIMKEETRDQVAEEELNAQITREISDLVCPKTTLIEKTTLITKKRRSTELKESPVVKKPLNEPKKMKYKKDVYKTRTSVQSSL